MAEQTIRLASFNGEEVTVDLIYDDQASDAVAVVYTNVTAFDGLFTVTKKSGSVSRSFTVPANSDAVREDLPNNLSVSFDARGNIRGWSFSMTWPV